MTLHSRLSAAVLTPVIGALLALLAPGVAAAQSPRPAVAAPRPMTGTATSSPSVAGSFVSLPPSRVLDTRSHLGAAGPAAPRGVVAVAVLGHGGVPSTGVSAVVVNLTVAGPAAAGYITAFPSATARPNVSNLNFTKAQTVANAAVVPVGADGKIDLYNGSGGVAPLVVDISGYYRSGKSAAPGTFTALTPSRVLDTRIKLGVGGPVPSDTGIAVPVLGVAGVPGSGVMAVVVNLTVTDAKSSGYITAYGNGTPRPTTSNLNFVAGQTVPNLAIVPVGADGKIRLFNGSGGNVALLADIAGYLRSGAPAVSGAFTTLTPSRLLDTRIGSGASGPVAAGSSVAVTVLGHGGVPAAGVAAVVVNLTATAPSAPGYLTAYADGAVRPTASVLNFGIHQSVPNLAVVPVGADGKIRIYNGSGGTTHLLADVAGYYRVGSGSVRSWGYGKYGDLGTGTTGINSLHLVSPTGLPAVTAVAAGTDSGYALALDGHVWGWGSGGSGELGSGKTDDSSKPQTVLGLSGVVAIAAGDYSAYALRTSGQVYSWGAGGSGKLGNGSTDNELLPARVSGLAGIVAIAAGSDNGYALQSDGSVWSWGSNLYGQLGVTTKSDSSVPVRVTGLTGVVSITASANSVWAVKADGTVWAWGYNKYGQLGNGTTGNSTTPVKAVGLPAVVQVAGGTYTAYALTADGQVRSWGYGGGGRLGNGGSASSLVPVPVSNLTSVVSISSGSATGYAVRADGTGWAWGAGGFGQLGTGGISDSSVPVKIPGLDHAVSIADGSSTGLAVTMP